MMDDDGEGQEITVANFTVDVRFYDADFCMYSCTPDVINYLSYTCLRCSTNQN